MNLNYIENEKPINTPKSQRFIDEVSQGTFIPRGNNDKEIDQVSGDFQSYPGDYIVYAPYIKSQIIEYKNNDIPVKNVQQIASPAPSPYYSPAPAPYYSPAPTPAPAPYYAPAPAPTQSPAPAPAPYYTAPAPNVNVGPSPSSSVSTIAPPYNFNINETINKNGPDFSSSVILPDGRIMFVPGYDHNVGIFDPCTNNFDKISARYLSTPNPYDNETSSSPATNQTQPIYITFTVRFPSLNFNNYTTALGKSVTDVYNNIFQKANMNAYVVIACVKEGSIVLELNAIFPDGNINNANQFNSILLQTIQLLRTIDPNVVLDNLGPIQSGTPIVSENNKGAITGISNGTGNNNTNQQAANGNNQQAKSNNNQQVSGNNNTNQQTTGNNNQQASGNNNQLANGNVAGISSYNSGGGGNVGNSQETVTNANPYTGNQNNTNPNNMNQNNGPFYYTFQIVFPSYSIYTMTAQIIYSIIEICNLIYTNNGINGQIYYSNIYSGSAIVELNASFPSGNPSDYIVFQTYLVNNISTLFNSIDTGIVTLTTVSTITYGVPPIISYIQPTMSSTGTSISPSTYGTPSQVSLGPSGYTPSSYYGPTIISPGPAPAPVSAPASAPTPSSYSPSSYGPSSYGPSSYSPSSYGPSRYGPSSYGPSSGIRQITNKKGFVYDLKINNVTNPNFNVQMQSLNLGWYYTWGLTGSPGLNLPFTPMVWGAPDVNNLTSIPNGSTELLGFNEPDGKNVGAQANVTIQNAITLWPMLKATGLRIGSVAASQNPLDTSYSSTETPPKQYPSSYFDQLWTGLQNIGYTPDFIALHWYAGLDNNGGGGGTDFLTWIDTIYAKYKKPIWITEMCVADWNATTTNPEKYTTQQIQAFMTQVVAGMNQRPYVERFSWKTRPVSDINMGNGALIADDGSLTPLGQYYATL